MAEFRPFLPVLPMAFHVQGAKVVLRALVGLAADVACKPPAWHNRMFREPPAWQDWKLHVDRLHGKTAAVSELAVVV